jgi:hypothetical protein
MKKNLIASKHGNNFQAQSKKTLISREKRDTKIKTKRRERRKQPSWFQWFIKMSKTPAGAILLLFIVVTVMVGLLRSHEERRDILISRLNKKTY